MNNRPEIVTLLLNKNGIDTAILNSNSKTARDEAVSRRYTDVIEVFDGGDTRYGTSSAQRLIQALKVGNVLTQILIAGPTDTECHQNSRPIDYSCRSKPRCQLRRYRHWQHRPTLCRARR